MEKWDRSESRESPLSLEGTRTWGWSGVQHPRASRARKDWNGARELSTSSKLPRVLSCLNDAVKQMSFSVGLLGMQAGVLLGISFCRQRALLQRARGRERRQAYSRLADLFSRTRQRDLTNRRDSAAIKCTPFSLSPSDLPSSYRL